MDEIFKEKKAARYLESSDQTSKETEKKPESARPELDGIPAASGAERHATVGELLSRNAALEQKLTEQRNIAERLEQSLTILRDRNRSLLARIDQLQAIGRV